MVSYGFFIVWFCVVNVFVFDDIGMVRVLRGTTAVTVWCGVVSGPGPAGSNAPPEQYVELRRLRPHGHQGHQQRGPSRGPAQHARARHGQGATEEEIPEELIG